MFRCRGDSRGACVPPLCLHAHNRYEPSCLALIMCLPSKRPTAKSHQEQKWQLDHQHHVEKCLCVHRHQSATQAYCSQKQYVKHMSDGTCISTVARGVDHPCICHFGSWGNFAVMHFKVSAHQLCSLWS